MSIVHVIGYLGPLGYAQVTRERDGCTYHVHTGRTPDGVHLLCDTADESTALRVARACAWRGQEPYARSVQPKGGRP